MTIQQVLDNTKQQLEVITGSKVLSVKFKTELDKTKLEDLKMAVCKAYDLRHEHLSKKVRRQKLVKPRQMFYYFAIELFGVDDTDAGNFCNQERTTAMHGRDKIRDFIHIQDPETLDKIRLVNEYLNN